MAKSKLAKIITGYTDNSLGNDNHAAAGKKFCAKKISGSVTVKTKNFLSSRPMRLLKKISELFSYAPAKTYGALFLSFGLLSLIICFSKNYFLGGSEAPLSSLIISAAFAVIAVPLMLVDSPISVMLENFKPTEVVFFEFFCIKRLYYTGNERALHPLLGAFIGVCLAALGSFIPVYLIAIGIAVLIFAAISFLSPEFTFFFTLLTLPYVSLIPYSSVILAAAAAFGALSFARKALFGKRVIFLEQYDVLICLMVLGILISGVFVKGMDSFVSALITSATFFGYFLASNILTNRRLADCAINAVALSSIPAASVSLAVAITHLLQGNAFGFVAHGISSTFDSSGSAAAFFLVAVIFSFVLVRQSHGIKKLVCAALLLLNITALLLTFRTAALIALILGALSCLSIKTGKKMLVLIPLLFLVPYALLLIPESVIASIPLHIYSAGAHKLILSSLSAFADNIFLGIGMGSESFVSEMEKYGVRGFYDSNNLFLELGLEAGILTLLSFLLLLIVRLGHRCSYQRYIKHSHMRKLSPLMSAAVFALISYGAFNYLFSDITISYLFWCVFGIGSGALRIAKSEHDDRIMYFEDEKSFDSAVININVG